jgi:hypothetical protein
MLRLSTLLGLGLTFTVAYPSFRDHLPNGFSDEEHPAFGHVAVR